MSWGSVFMEKVSGRKAVLIALALITFLVQLMLSGHNPGGISGDIVEFSQHLLRDVSISFMVAVVLLVAIEVDHRRHLDDSFQKKLEAISQNVFSGVFNTKLPSAYIHRIVDDMLKAELVREDMSVTYTLSDRERAVDGETVRWILVEADTTYILRNISENTVIFPIGISLPNPMVPEMKGDVRIGLCKFNAEELLTPEHTSALRFLLNSSSNTCKVEIKNVEVPPNARIPVQMSYSMAKEVEDTEVFRTVLAVDAVSIHVFDRTRDGLEIEADAIRVNMIERISGSDGARAHRWRTTGYTLPWQGVLFWWKRRQSEFALTPGEGVPEEKVGSVGS